MRSGWRRSRRAVAVLCLFAALTGLGATAWVVWSDHATVQKEIRREALTLSQLIAEHAGITIRGGDVAARRVIDLLGSRDLAGIVTDKALWTQVTRIADEMPTGGSIGILDTAGDLLLSTVRFPAPGTSHADREYFARHQSGAQLVIGGGLTGMITGQRFFTVSRRIERAGAFVGVAVAGVRLDYFARLYRELNLSPRSSLGMFRDDGLILMREPWRDQRDALVPREVLARIKSGDTVHTARSQFDDAVRFYRSQRVADYPVYATVAVSVDDRLEQWRHRLAYQVAAGAAALLSLLTLAWLVLRSLDGERRVMAALEARSDKLRAALQHKNVLIREIHHRVKNNLQIISSLMRLAAQSRHSAESIVLDSTRRIRALAFAHDQLHKQDQPDEIDAGEYVRKVSEGVMQSFAAHDVPVALDVQTETIHLAIDRAQPLGLILNEVMTNALRHAFEGRDQGRIAVGLRCDENRNIVLSVSDDGIGLPRNDAATATLGRVLIEQLAQQLDAAIAIHADGGTHFRLVMPARR
jgi:two-component sensor histidine kinase